MLCVFFFQAEDGIRDLVRSRGLGDVYKRQVPAGKAVSWADVAIDETAEAVKIRREMEREGADAVSYTHLTLPTSDLV